MAWVRIHDGALSHPKITGIVDLTNPFTLWVWGLSNCQMHLTDGLIVRDAIPRAALPAARNLVKRGLWEPHDVGWKVHNFLKWNDCRDLVLERQTKAKERKEAWKEKQRNERAAKKSGTRSEHVPNASGTLREQRENGQPNLTKPNLTKKEHEERVPEGFERFWAVYPKRDGRKVAIAWWASVNPDPEFTARIIAGAEAYVRQVRGWKARYIKSPINWLNGGHWEDESAQAADERPYECRHVAPPCENPGNWRCRQRTEIEKAKAS